MKHYYKCVICHYVHVIDGKPLFSCKCGNDLSYGGAREMTHKEIKSYHSPKSLSIRRILLSLFCIYLMINSLWDLVPQYNQLHWYHKVYGVTLILYIILYFFVRLRCYSLMNKATRMESVHINNPFNDGGWSIIENQKSLWAQEERRKAYLLRINFNWFICFPGLLLLLIGLIPLFWILPKNIGYQLSVGYFWLIAFTLTDKPSIKPTLQ